MAYTKIHAIKTTVNKAITYICNSDKTDDKIFISSYACSPETAAIDFKYTLDHCSESSQNKAFHLIQAFEPGEVSFEEAHLIGKELADKVLEGKYSYVVTTHIDKDHVHNHIIFCAADNIEHNKYHDCKKTYYRIRNLSDALCKEHNLSVIIPSGKSSMKYNEWQADKNEISWKTQIRKDINQSIKSSSNYEEFLIFLKAKGYEIKEGKYISFRPIGKDRFVRGSAKSLGNEYTKERIKDRIENKQQQIINNFKKDKKINKLIDTSSDTKYQENIGLQKWASKENLKIAAKTYSLMNSKNINNFSELSNKMNSIQKQSKASNESIITLEHKIKNLTEIIKYVEQYQDNQPYNLKYENAKNKDSVFRKYESQLILFGGAKRMLKRANINPTTVNIDTLKTEYKKLIQGKNDFNSTFKNCQKELKELDLIKQNMEQYFKTTIEKEPTKDKNHSHSNQEL